MDSNRFNLAKEATAGAVVYKIAIKTKAYPADFLAAPTSGTVKNRTITCGNPAVPSINAAVIQNTSMVDLDPDVYASKPSWIINPSSFCSR